MNSAASIPSISGDLAARNLIVGHARSDVRVWLGTCAIVAALFLALQNVYWIPGGDSEVYVASARNIATGHGNLFNGLPARIAPPGWTLVLAFVMKFITPEFLALKLVAMLSMTSALSIYYWILRRFVAPRVSALMIIATALISHVYSLTFWLHSDALFTLITGATLLLAMQINERKPNGWRIVLLLFLCACSSAVRWAAVLNVALIAGALLSGPRWRDEKIWICCAAVVLMTLGSFFAMRWAVHHYAPPRVPFENTAQMDASAVLGDERLGEGGESKEPSIVTGTGRGNTGYATRIAGFGTWFSFLLWQPFRLAGGSNAIWWTATGIGWVVAGFVIAACAADFRERRFLLPAMLLYTLALDLNWPHATARYLVPVAPLMVLAIVRGAAVLKEFSFAGFVRQMKQRRARSPVRAHGFPMGEGATVQDRSAQDASLRDASTSPPVHPVAALPAAPGWQRRLVSAVAVVGFASVILCNAALYGIDVWVMRSSRFADRYEAGMDKGLIAAAEYLNGVRAGNWQVCINPEYINVGRRRMSPTSLRMLTMMTGKATLQLPVKFTTSDHKLPRDHEFREWIGRNKVSYYLEQPPISPWRVWHFRMGWLQRMESGEDPIDNGGGWSVYRCEGKSVPVKVTIPEMKDWPRRVPGISK